MISMTPVRHAQDASAAHHEGLRPSARMLGRPAPAVYRDGSAMLRDPHSTRGYRARSPCTEATGDLVHGPACRRAPPAGRLPTPRRQRFLDLSCHEGTTQGSRRARPRQVSDFSRVHRDRRSPARKIQFQNATSDCIVNRYRSSRLRLGVSAHRPNRTEIGR